MEATEVRARVALGGTWLDGVAAPEWPWQVDLAKLDMSNPFRCVLGQLFDGMEEEVTGCSYALNHLFPGGWEQGKRLGFWSMDVNKSSEYEVLTEEWARYVLQRRAAMA